MKAFARALRKLGGLPQTFSATRRFSLVRLDGARYAPRQIEIAVSVSGAPALVVTLEGSEVAYLPSGRWGFSHGLPPRLVAQLSTFWRNWRVTHPGQKLVREVLMAVDPRVRWEVIVGLVRGLSDLGVRRVGMLVAVSYTPPPMPQSRATAAVKALQRELEQSLDPSRKATLLDRKTPVQLKVEAHWRRATQRCPQIKRAIRKVRNVGPDRKGTVLVESVARALVACRCQADIATIHARLYMTLLRRPTGVVWLRHQKRGRRVARAASEAWRKTVTSWLRRTPRGIVRGRLVAKTR
ncbi:MAG: hypothetical protein KC503_06835 [Myxococcales bacterium]|nr:hypothetical protein [Myxococcales bacterium]